MRLRFATIDDEMRSRILLRETEEPEGDRMHFRYLNAKDDPTPDVLVLGEFNDLIGGINLNYLSPEQLRELKEVMPQILQGTNLKQRYHYGMQLLPDVFDEYYRTYDTQYIQPITPETLPTWEPKPMMPQRPPQRPPVQPPAAPPAPARPAPAAPPAGVGMPPRAPVQRPIPQPPVEPPMEPMAPAAPTIDQADMATLAAAYKKRMEQAAAIKAKQDEQLAQVTAQKKLDQERTSNLQDLMTPSKEDPLQVGESITYYSPVQGRYLTEKVRL